MNIHRKYKPGPSQIARYKANTMPKHEDLTQTLEHITVFGPTTANYPPDDGYPTPEQVRAMADEITYRSGKKLDEIQKAAVAELTQEKSHACVAGTFVKGAEKDCPGCNPALRIYSTTNTTPSPEFGNGTIPPETMSKIAEQLEQKIKEADARYALKFDQDKLPLHLLSTEAMNQTAAVLKFGAQKYAEHNWRKGFAWSRPLAAAMRHITAFNAGEDTDPESGLSHLAHAACCIMFLLEFEKTHQHLDDRYKPDVQTLN